MLELTIELAFCLQIAMVHFDLRDASNWLEGFDMLLALFLSGVLFSSPVLILAYFCSSKERISRLEDKEDAESIAKYILRKSG